MKNENKENIVKESVSDTKIEEIKGSIDDKLDSIGIYLEKIEAFNQLINLKLDEIKTPPTKQYKQDNTINSLAIDIFSMQNNINNYIMLSYTITDFTTKIQQQLNEIHDQLQEINK